MDQSDMSVSLLSRSLEIGLRNGLHIPRWNGMKIKDIRNLNYYAFVW